MFRLMLLAQAQGYADAGVHEIGDSNSGPLVDHFLRSVGDDPGESWCDAFISCCGMEAAMRQGSVPPGDFITARKWLGQNFFVASGYCPDTEADARRRGTWQGPEYSPQPGDLVLYDFRRIGASHHIGTVESVEADGTLHTIEGNTTQPGTVGDEANGGGVYRKTRTRQFVRGFVALGNS